MKASSVLLVQWSQGKRGQKRAVGGQLGWVGVAGTAGMLRGGVPWKVLKSPLRFLRSKGVESAPGVAEAGVGWLEPGTSTLRRHEPVQWW